MKDKRGQGISMEFIIIAAIALVVLIVIILFFTGGLERIFGGQRDVVESVTAQQKEIWRSECKLYCSLGQKENFQNKKFRGEDKQDYYCNKGSGQADLDVTCTVCSGMTAGCSQITTQKECNNIGCSWDNWELS